MLLHNVEMPVCWTWEGKVPSRHLFYQAICSSPHAGMGTCVFLLQNVNQEDTWDVETYHLNEWTKKFTTIKYTLYIVMLILVVIMK